ncbi:MAG: dihydrolipoyl dehydrogenase, partial [Candidatus Poseidoniia archaeon]|nr:dihydrolipoyl dehydrogenase [Candidatus Poseidoniia archaeon]
MSKTVKITVPNLGDFETVEIVEVHTEAGQSINIDDPLITLETEKAAMDVPCTVNGILESISVSLGDQVSEGDVIASVKVDMSSDEDESSDQPQPKNNYQNQTGLVVIGSGPGGYTAAFRASDLGLDVTLIEKHTNLGGVCLNVGCIPSKTLLHAAKIINDSKEAKTLGLNFGEPEIELEKMKDWKNQVVSGLTQGLQGLSKKRNINVIQGIASFTSANTVKITNGKDEQTLSFEQCIIAVGSNPATLPFLPDDPRIIDSTDALELSIIPNKMLIIGGGIIGLEMATIYASLGSSVSIVELTETLMPGTDRDLVKPLEKHLKKQCDHIYKSVEVSSATSTKKGIEISFKGRGAPESAVYDSVLVAVGRLPNIGSIDPEEAGIQLDQNGFVQVDRQMRTNVPNIFAIGDIVGEPMLAHKASHEARVAAEVVSGMKTAMDSRCIPSVAYTDPEVAWVGLTEEDCIAQEIDYGKGVFPWAA